MRQQVLVIGVVLALQHRCVVVQAHAAVGIEIANPDPQTLLLHKPDGGGIRAPQVPRRRHRQLRLVRHLSDALLVLGPRHELAVIGADDGGLERAFKLLPILLVRHIFTGVGQLGFVYQTCLAGLEPNSEPVLRLLRGLPNLIKLVVPLRRSDEHRPTLPIGQSRPDDLGPQTRVHIRELVQDHAIEVDAAQAVRVVGAVQPHPASVRHVDPQFANQRIPAWDRRGIVNEVLPGHVLGLLVQRRDVGKARVVTLAFQRTLDQLVDATDGLAGPTMGDNTGVTLSAIVKWLKLRSRGIRDFYPLDLAHRISNASGPPSLPVTACGALPSTRSLISLIA